jgi:hypothetical protein
MESYVFRFKCELLLLLLLLLLPLPLQQPKHKMSIESFFIKKKRPLENSDNVQSSSSSTLTPEQKQRIEHNRQLALKRRKSAILDLDALLTRASWREALHKTLTSAAFQRIETYLVS